MTLISVVIVSAASIREINYKYCHEQVVGTWSLGNNA